MQRNGMPAPGGPEATVVSPRSRICGTSHCVTGMDVSSSRRLARAGVLAGVAPAADVELRGPQADVLELGPQLGETVAQRLPRRDVGGHEVHPDLVSVHGEPDVHRAEAPRFFTPLPTRPARLGGLLGKLDASSPVARCYTKYVAYFEAGPQPSGRAGRGGRKRRIAGGA